METRVSTTVEPVAPQEVTLRVIERREVPRPMLKEVFQQQEQLDKAVAALDEMKKLQTEYAELLQPGTAIKHSRDVNSRLPTPAQVLTPAFVLPLPWSGCFSPQTCFVLHCL